MSCEEAEKRLAELERRYNAGEISLEEFSDGCLELYLSVGK